MGGVAKTPSWVGVELPAPEHVESVTRVGVEKEGRANTPMLAVSGSRESKEVLPHDKLATAEAHERWHRPSARQPSPSGRRQSGVK